MQVRFCNLEISRESEKSAARSWEAPEPNGSEIRHRTPAREAGRV